MTTKPEELFSAFTVEVTHQHYSRIEYQVHRSSTELTFYDAEGNWMGTRNIMQAELPTAGKSWTVTELPSRKTETFKVVRTIGRPTITVRWR